MVKTVQEAGNTTMATITELEDMIMVITTALVIMQTMDITTVLHLITVMEIIVKVTATVTVTVINKVTLLIIDSNVFILD